MFSPTWGADISEAEFQYVLDAVHLLADEGWKLPGPGAVPHRA
jgi:hypothetical protein